MQVTYQIGSVLNGRVLDCSVTWLIVRDNFGQPIAAIEQVSPDHVLVTTCSDEKFHDVIKRYGVDKLARTEVVNDGT